jgi:TRAP-type C4-dicarboxylate transport system substrate-binding protein
MTKKIIKIIGKPILLLFLGCLLILSTLSISYSASPDVNWRMQCSYPPPEEIFPGIPGAYGQALKLSRMIEKASDGHFKIKVYHSGALFKTPEIFNAVSTGAIDMGYAASLYWGGKFPEASVEFGLPGFMATYEQAKKMVWETDWLNILRRNYQTHGVYLLADVEVSQYNLILKFPCHHVSDLKGKKIRASGMYAQAMDLFGAVPVKIEPAEQYVALQRGTIDGVLYPAYTGIMYKFFEVAKYATWPGISAPSLVPMIVNLQAYNNLPQDYKDLLNNQAKEWSKWCFDNRGQASDKYVKKHGPEDYGAVMIDLPSETITKFHQLSQPLWKDYEQKSEDCKSLINLLRKATKGELK